ncbi:hypothetical protein CHRYSEOSP005_29770 [Chryseobacterium sp. Alg-005]
MLKLHKRYVRRRYLYFVNFYFSFAKAFTQQVCGKSSLNRVPLRTKNKKTFADFALKLNVNQTQVN